MRKRVAVWAVVAVLIVSAALIGFQANPREDTSQSTGTRSGGDAGPMSVSSIDLINQTEGLLTYEISYNGAYQKGELENALVRTVDANTNANATFVECDVTDYEALKDAVAAADEFGGIDTMVNNAGVFRAEEFLEEGDDIFDMIMNINVRGTYYGSRAAANAMLDNGGGSIVNLSSVAGLEGSGEFISYCASKGAVRLMTYSLASLLGPEGVRVNAIHPGLIETSMTTEDVPIFGTDEEAGFIGQVPSGRGGTAEDVAKGALFLASDLSDYVNSESLVIDGGMTNSQ